MILYFVNIAAIASPGVSNSGGAGTANTLLIVLIILLAVILGAVYFVFSSNKKYFDTKRIEIQKLFDSYKDQNKIWEKKFAEMKKKLDKDENERKVWKEEKKNLVQEIKDLKAQIELLAGNDSDDNSDIVVEYFVDRELPRHHRTRHQKNKYTQDKQNRVRGKI